MTIYVCREGVEIGRYSRPDFEYMLLHHRLFHTDHFWYEGMEEWKLVSAAKAYFSQHERCRHCGSRMSEQKPVTGGAHCGQLKSICLKCGHAEYHPAGGAPTEADDVPVEADSEPNEHAVLDSSCEDAEGSFQG